MQTSALARRIVAFFANRERRVLAREREPIAPRAWCGGWMLWAAVIVLVIVGLWL